MRSTTPPPFLPPTSGLARRLPGICLSASLTADFGPGPEAAAEGCTSGREVCFQRLSQSTSGLARRGRREGRPTKRGVCFSWSWESPTASARRHWRRGIWTMSLNPCASRIRVRADGGLAGRTAAAAGSGGSIASAPSQRHFILSGLFFSFQFLNLNSSQMVELYSNHRPLSPTASSPRLNRLNAPFSPFSPSLAPPCLALLSCRLRRSRRLSPTTPASSFLAA